jgi:hypothetical protein
MGKLSLSILCFGATLAIATSAFARGTYHHSEPYVEHPDPHKTHSWPPVIVYSPEHGHFHKTYHPHWPETRVLEIGN